MLAEILAAFGAVLRRTGVQLTIPFEWTGYSKVNSRWTYFTETEVQGLDSELVAMLDKARHIAGVPFVLTSTVRTCAANQAALGAEHSTHLKGLAVDIGLGHLQAGEEQDGARFRILDGLYTVGFKRLGLYKAHIHCDLGKAPDYTEQVAWFSPAA